MAVQLAEHRAVGGRRGEQDGDPVARPIAGSRLVAARPAPAAASQAPARSGKTSRPPRPKVKPSGGLPRTRRPGTWLQHLAGEGVGDGEQVPVEVHTALGASGGPRGEGDQRDLVGGRCPLRGTGRSRSARPPAGSGPRGRPHRTGSSAAPPRPPWPGPRPSARRTARGSPGRSSRWWTVHSCVLGQYGHGDRARLHDGEPARGQPGCGRSAQQHPVAGHHGQVVGEHMGDAGPRGLPQLAVAPDAPVAGAQRGAVGTASSTVRSSSSCPQFSRSG
ncbi:hypothetical protein SMICM17S_04174 [Streptomyces microflavus]